MTNSENEAVWEETTLQDWLELSDVDMEYIEMKVRLGIALRKAREAKQLSQRALAKQLETGQARVARMESADNSVSIDALMRSLLSLGVSSSEISLVIAG